jgi:hypothetical protein
MKYQRWEFMKYKVLLVLPSQFPATLENTSSQFLITLTRTPSRILTSQPQHHTTPPHLSADLLSSPMVYILSPPSHLPFALSYSSSFKVSNVPHIPSSSKWAPFLIPFFRPLPQTCPSSSPRPTSLPTSPGQSSQAGPPFFISP